MDVSLPFELVAVEAALSSCCKSLEQEAADLEHRAEPSLVRLSQKVSRKELENVKNYKATLNRLIVRVSKVKSVSGSPGQHLSSFHSDVPSQCYDWALADSCITMDCKLQSCVGSVRMATIMSG